MYSRIFTKILRFSNTWVYSIHVNGVASLSKTVGCILINIMRSRVYCIIYEGIILLSLSRRRSEISNERTNWERRDDFRSSHDRLSILPATAEQQIIIIIIITPCAHHDIVLYRYWLQVYRYNIRLLMWYKK